MNRKSIIAQMLKIKKNADNCKNTKRAAEEGKEQESWRGQKYESLKTSPFCETIPK